MAQMTVKTAARIVELGNRLGTVREAIKVWEKVSRIQVRYTYKDQWDRDVEQNAGVFAMAKGLLGETVRDYMIRRYREEEAAIIREFNQLDVKVPDDGK